MIVPPGQNIGGRVPPLGGPVPLSHSDRRPCSMPINAVTSVQRCISIEQKLPTRYTKFPQQHGFVFIRFCSAYTGISVNCTYVHLYWLYLFAATNTKVLADVSHSSEHHASSSPAGSSCPDATGTCCVCCREEIEPRPKGVSAFRSFVPVADHRK